MTAIAKIHTVFETPWFSLRGKTIAADPDGAPFYAIHAPDYVCVVAVTQDNRVVLVRQYRPAVESWCLELPAGGVSAGETPEAAARRELREETGYRAISFECLGVLKPDTGRLENRQWCYFARVEPDPEPLAPEDGELGLECQTLSLEEFRAALGQEGQLDHSLNLAAVMLALLSGHLSLSGGTGERVT